MAVEHQRDQRRFVTPTASGEAELTYTQPRAGVLDLKHTFVPDADRGAGIGESLVAAAVAHAAAEDVRLVPSCPFVRSWLARHPEHAARFVAPG